VLTRIRRLPESKVKPKNLSPVSGKDSFGRVFTDKVLGGITEVLIIVGVEIFV
jgi:UTP-glucose-1-phosphate uridylyltransferase